ncbi:MAG: hypothetical protein ABIG84_01940 [archaeon]
MRVSIDVMPKDTPGELIRILAPISELGGNIITVIHRRDELSAKGRLPVHLVFEIDSKEQYEKILERYNDENIKVIKMDELKRFNSLVIGMIGHIVRTDLSETINTIDSLGFCKVVDLQIEMPEKKRESCAIFHIEFDDSINGGKSIVMSKIKEICKRKSIQIVEAA